MTNTQDAIAAFLAKGGRVAKIDANATCGMTDRQWHRASRDDVVTVVLGKAYLPSHACAVVISNCLSAVSDRHRQLYLKIKGIVAEFNADPEPEIERYDARLRYCIGDMLSAIEDAYSATIYDGAKGNLVMTNELWNALRAASKALNFFWRPSRKG